MGLIAKAPPGRLRLSGTGVVVPQSTQGAFGLEGLRVTYSLHCSSFLGLPFRILNVKLVKPKKGNTMETIGILLSV